MADHVIFAAVYDRILAPAEAHGLAARRRRLLSFARGRVLEIGAGTGLNLAHYPPEVTSLVLLEPDGAMRRHLTARLAASPTKMPVEVRAAGVQDLRPEDGVFDTVVSTLVLCAVPDLGRAVRRVGEVLEPGGDVLFLEHVGVPGVRGHLQRMSTPVWKHLTAGCHLDRDPVMAFADADMAVIDLERFDLPAVGLMRAAVQGRARRRAPAAADPVGTLTYESGTIGANLSVRLGGDRPEGDQ